MEKKQMRFAMESSLVLLSLALPVVAHGECTPVHMTAAEARQHMLDQLHITSLRPAFSGSPTGKNPANFDESKAGPFSKPPDPLVLNNGKRVTTAKMWWDQRRPQIEAAYTEEVLGEVPSQVPSVRWEVLTVTQGKIGDVPIITKKLLGHVDNSGCPAIQVNIDVTLTTPAGATGPVPVIMEMDIDAATMALFAKRFPNRPQPTGPTWQQQVLAHGWGYASYIPTTVQPDNGAAITEGIIGLVNKGLPRKPDDWGALRAWAWGASRALDYFETDKAVDARRVGITGHSRYGKASIIAMAYDKRFAIGYISSSGEGGAKLYRHLYGEGEGNLAADEVYWMAGNFMKYDGPLTINDLPVDAHDLIAMCAPRPIFIGGGSTEGGDGWVDAKGMFLAAAGADPVYRLLGARGLGSSTFPPMETALTTGMLAFRQHHEGHTPAPNWPYFLDWAKPWLDKPAGLADAVRGAF